MSTQQNEILEICGKAKNGAVLDKNDVIKLLEASDTDAQLIFETANKIREEQMGNEVHLRGLIEFSNYCKRICTYCGIRAGVQDLTRYRLSVDEIVKTAVNAEKLGYRSVVLQSGEDPFYTADVVAAFVDGIKRETDLAITLSIGEYSYQDYKLMKEAGADRFLLRFETSDRELYKKLHPDSDLDSRLECLKILGQLNFQVGTGFMVGLPGETTDIFANNLLLLREFNVDMAGIGPFIPNPKTPLSATAGGTLVNSLKAVALARILLRDAHIPATTAMGTLNPKGREMALNAGANVVMPNVTPMQYREMYQLYPDKICLTDDPGHCRNCITGKIHGLGRTVAKDHGHSLKKLKKEQ